MSSGIKKLISNGESELVEFHGSRTRIQTLGKSICGMLNQQGGTILFGVDDRGNASSVEDAEAQVDQIHEYLADSLSPLALYSVVKEDLDGQTIIVIDVPQGADKPYSLNREIYVRVGSQTLLADANTSSTIVRKSASQLDRWEYESLPGFELKDCLSDAIAQARAEIFNSGRLGPQVPDDDYELLRRLRLTHDGQLTNAAAVLFAMEPLDWSPNLAIRIVAYANGKGGDIANDATISGPAVQTLYDAVWMIQQRTGYSGRFSKVAIQRSDVPAYPMFALREGLVNAIVHRDYSIIGGQVRVEIFKDHLTIQNPGRLPEGWTPTDLRRSHGSVPFNPNIARVFYLRGLMEQLGIGTQKVIEECKKLKAAAPRWDDEQNMVTLTLFPSPEPNLQAQLNDRQSQFLKSTHEGESYKSSDYAKLVGVVERQARRELSELVDLGLVKRSGNGPSTVYIRTGPNNPD